MGGLVRLENLDGPAGPYPADTHILGYRILTNEPDFVRFSVRWRVGLRCELVLSTRPESVTLDLFVEFERTAAKILWRAMVPIHELSVPYWLGRAARIGPTRGPLAAR